MNPITTNVRILVAIFFLCFLYENANSQNARGISPLFGDTTLLHMLLTVPVDSIVRDACSNPSWFSSSLDGISPEQYSFQTTVRKRGKFRCDPRNCAFPPLWVRFSKKQVKGTPFAGQDRIKLVLPCQPKSRKHSEYILREYLVYRMFNILTDSSFRVRLVRLTLHDAGGKMDSIPCYSFFIEQDDDLARRISGKVYNATNVHPEDTQKQFMTLVEVFQYMIGNTDYSVSMPHNITLFSTDPFQPPLAIPYDFDWSGAVGTSYSIPAESLGIDGVAQRVYLGHCRSEAELDLVLNRFIAKKEAIFELIQTFPYLPQRERKSLGRYLDGFYSIIENPRHRRAELIYPCKKQQ